MIKYFKIKTIFQEIEEWEPGCWMRVTNPTQDEIDTLTERFHVPQDFINDVSDIDERPRLELDDDWKLIIIRIPHQTDDMQPPFITIPLGMFINGEIFITLCYFETPLLNDFIEHKKLKKIQIRNYFELFLRFHITASVWYLKHVKRLGQMINVAESELEKSIQNRELLTLLDIEKSLVFFTTSLKGNNVLLGRVKLSSLAKNNLDEEILELIEDAEIENQQAIALVEIYSNIMTGMMDAFASVISNNLNVIVKRLTSISIIIMVPTLVSSIYGMNIPNGLESNNFAFAGIIIASILFSIITILLFRKSNWL